MSHVKHARFLFAFSLTVVGVLALVAGCSQKGADDSASGATGVVAAVSSIAGQADLTGTWKLNVEQSDSPPGPRPDSGWHGGPPPDSGSQCPGPPPDSGWQRHGPPPGDSTGGHPGPRDHRGRPPLASPQFTITQTDSAITFASDSSRTMTLYTDGRVTTPGDTMHHAELRTYWNESDALVIEHSHKGGGTMTETISRSADGQQLVIVTHMDDTRVETPVDFRRVYDLLTGGE